MSTIASSSETLSTTPLTLADTMAVPWRELSSRIREALTQRNYFIASSDELRVLWEDERIDSAERRRRIIVFAAKHHWKVETQPDGNSARFLVSTPSGLISLSRTHE